MYNNKITVLYNVWSTFSSIHAMWLRMARAWRAHGTVWPQLAENVAHYDVSWQSTWSTMTLASKAWQGLLSANRNVTKYYVSWQKTWSTMTLAWRTRSPVWCQIAEVVSHFDVDQLAMCATVRAASLLHQQATDDAQWEK